MKNAKKLIYFLVIFLLVTVSYPAMGQQLIDSTVPVMVFDATIENYNFHGFVSTIRYGVDNYRLVQIPEGWPSASKKFTIEISVGSELSHDFPVPVRTWVFTPYELAPLGTIHIRWETDVLPNTYFVYKFSNEGRVFEFVVYPLGTRVYIPLVGKGV